MMKLQSLTSFIILIALSATVFSAAKKIMMWKRMFRLQV